MRLSPTFLSGVSLYQPQAFQRLLDPFSSCFHDHLRNIFLGHGEDDSLDFKDHASGSLTHTNPLMSLGVFSFSFCFGERVEEEGNLVFFGDITDETLASYKKTKHPAKGEIKNKERGARSITTQRGRGTRTNCFCSEIFKGAWTSTSEVVIATWVGIRLDANK
jgi:hypothetical protein